MARRLAIFHPPGRFVLAHNPFGKDVANLQLFQALARHGGFERLHVLSTRPAGDLETARELFEGEPPPGATEVRSGSILNQAAAAEAGALLRGQPELQDLAWQRRRHGGDGAYSLMGLVHTIAPPAMRQIIASTATAPMHPWDAVICTSPAVREGLERMFDDWGAHLAERTGGRPPPRPALPIVPLGVDAPAFAALADRPEARRRLRAELGLAEADVLILWVGRLSYFEKAFPQPMFAAAQRAARATGARPTLVMAGWFPGESDHDAYQAAAQAWAPDVTVRFEDGNDRARLGELWAAADVFLSLVDNIQETFGITPLEAMAAGLPVVASDWDGYRYTMRHGVEALLVPTLMGPAGGGIGAALAARHMLEGESYQAYVGAIAQHTAVHIPRAGEALAELIRSPELRRRLGAAGRRRVAEAFDWPVVARAYNALADELAVLRAAAPPLAAARRAHPIKGDPFAEFAHFASQALNVDTVLRAAPGASRDEVLQAGRLPLNVAFGAGRASPEVCAGALELLAARGPRTVRDILLAFPVEQRRSLEMGLAWMAKYGFVDWLT